MTIKCFSREDDVSVDETAVVHRFFANSQAANMIDVGAHHGSAFKPFLDDGWAVHAFEPDPTNRKYIEDRYSDNPRLTLNNYAVGNESGKELSFYASEQSTGISSLIPFHGGHKEIAKVPTIRLDDYLKFNPLEEVAFLKIDTEGFDLRVIEGFPWERLKPAVIECEFEDAKTTKIGYVWQDLAKFLVRQGYTVYVSEWHPILRYGIRHQWRQLLKFPTKSIDGNSWGNFVAFRDKISTAEVEALFLAELGAKNPNKVLTAAPGEARAEVRMGGNPIKNQVGIFTNFIKSTPGVIISSLLGLGGLLMAFSTEIANVASLPAMKYVLMVGGFLVLLQAFAYTLARTRHEMELRPNAELAKLQSDVRSLAATDRTSDFEAQAAELAKSISALKAQTNKRDQANVAKFEKSLNALKMELNKHAEPSVAARSHQDAVNQQVEELRVEFDELQAHYLDLKLKLPEILLMINNIRAEFETTSNE